MKPALALVLFTAVLTSCTSSTPSETPVIGQFGNQAVLGIANGTTLTVSLFVNGRQVATSTPGVAVPPIAFADLPALPLTVEARSPSGRVLTSMDVKPGSVTATIYPDGHVATGGTFGRVDLSCGRLTIWAGYDQPSGPPPPSPAGSPGDCAA